MAGVTVADSGPSDKTFGWCPAGPYRNFPHGSGLTREGGIRVVRAACPPELAHARLPARHVQWHLPRDDAKARPDDDVRRVEREIEDDRRIDGAAVRHHRAHAAHRWLHALAEQQAEVAVAELEVIGAGILRSNVQRQRQLVRVAMHGG